MPNSSYKWDKYSDQPAILRDKALKKSIKKRGAIGTLKTFLTALLLPFFALTLLFRRRTITNKPVDNIGLCVNADYPIEGKRSPSNTELRAMVDELGVNSLLIRFPLSDWQNRQKYYDLITLFADKKILINILQDRDHIEDADKTTAALRDIFSRCQAITDEFQIGNTVNRKKWAFISQDDYFQFFHTAQQLRDAEFPQLKLLGGNIIDFELPFFLRSVMHAWPIRYDGVAAQLYVDRRGAPEKTQMHCDTVAKINWFSHLLRISPKTANSFYITEVNWPLSGTEPWAPAKGDCMVDEHLQTTYLVRYYLLMMATGRVDKCFWHQLIAPGYGLVDNRGEQLRKRDAYYSFKTLIQLTQGCSTGALSEKNDEYALSFQSDRGPLSAYWAVDKTYKVDVSEQQQALDILGQALAVDASGQIEVSDQVIYILDQPS